MYICVYTYVLSIYCNSNVADTWLYYDHVCNLFISFYCTFFCIYLPCPVTAHYRVHPRWRGQRHHGWGLCHKGYISMYNKQLWIMTKSIQEAPAFHECCIFWSFSYVCKYVYYLLNLLYYGTFCIFILLNLLWHFLSIYCNSNAADTWLYHDHVCNLFIS